MELIIEYIRHVIDPDWIMQNGGLYLVVVILFIETGLFFGFFLPGDPLLFISGMVIASANETHYPFDSGMLNLPFWITLFILSTIAGNFLGYWFGKKFQYLIDRKEDTWFLKKKHLHATREFYERKGGLTIAIARFFPILRTFAPIIAGTVQMNRRKFAFYNIAGAILWVGTLTITGYLLGDNPWVRKNVEYVILGILAVVTLPLILKSLVRK